MNPKHIIVIKQVIFAKQFIPVPISIAIIIGISGGANTSLLNYFQECSSGSVSS